MRNTSMRIVLSYDVVDDARRRRLATRVCSFLHRVQYSVFEGTIKESRLQDLRAMTSRVIEHSTDSARIYQLCSRCREAIEVVGKGPLLMDGTEDVVI